MKNKKIKLEDLKVKSFITKGNQVEKKTVKGGATETLPPNCDPLNFYTVFPCNDSEGERCTVGTSDIGSV